MDGDGFFQLPSKSFVKSVTPSEHPRRQGGKKQNHTWTHSRTQWTWPQALGFSVFPMFSWTMASWALKHQTLGPWFFSSLGPWVDKIFVLSVPPTHNSWSLKLWAPCPWASMSLSPWVSSPWGQPAIHPRVSPRSVDAWVDQMSIRSIPVFSLLGSHVLDSWPLCSQDPESLGPQVLSSLVCSLTSRLSHTWPQFRDPWVDQVSKLSIQGLGTPRFPSSGLQAPGFRFPLVSTFTGDQLSVMT